MQLQIITSSFGNVSPMEKQLVPSQDNPLMADMRHVDMDLLGELDLEYKTASAQVARTLSEIQNATKTNKISFAEASSKLSNLFSSLETARQCVCVYTISPSVAPSI